jgi:hypothetical protein
MINAAINPWHAGACKRSQKCVFMYCCMTVRFSEWKSTLDFSVMHDKCIFCNNNYGCLSVLADSWLWGTTKYTIQSDIILSLTWSTPYRGLDSHPVYVSAINHPTGYIQHYIMINLPAAYLKQYIMKYLPATNIICYICILGNKLNPWNFRGISSFPWFKQKISLIPEYSKEFAGQFKSNLIQNILA